MTRPLPQVFILYILFSLLVGCSTTPDRATAEKWAEARALERGKKPVVLEANVKDLPAPRKRPGETPDPNERRIDVEDYNKVGPGIFKEVDD